MWNRSTGAKKDMQGLCNLDIKNIINAWDDRYIKRKELRGTLKTMDEYHQGYESTGHSGKGKLREGEEDRKTVTWRQKRCWIMQIRANVMLQEKLNNEDREISHNGSPIPGNLNPFVNQIGTSISRSFSPEVGETPSKPPKQKGYVQVESPILGISSGS